jgi:hypothetical protein
VDTSEFWIWRQALDDEPTHPAPPGMLSEFLTPGSSDIREAVGRRIEQTPGCFYYRLDDTAAQLRISAVAYHGHSLSLVREFAAARRGDDQLADGRVLDVPVDPRVLFETLGLGFARVINPPPPPEWRDARREYNALAREVLSDKTLGLHTPKQVDLAFRAGSLQDGSGAWQRWQDIRPTFRVHRETVWLDRSVLQFVADYAASEELIVWTAFPAFGRELSRLTGMPFFHEQGVDSRSGEYLQTTRGGRSVIASIAANATGRNLQDRWSRNLIVGCPGKADLLQQLIGRTHRRGQPASLVQVVVLLASIEHVMSLYRARERALYDRSMNRALESRLLDCDWAVKPVAAYKKRSSPWQLRR